MRNCHLRFRRHTWYWTGSGYQSFWGGWRNERRCQDCGVTEYIPGVRGMLVQPGPPPGIDILEHVGGAPHPMRPAAVLPPTEPPPKPADYQPRPGEPRTCPFCSEVVHSTGEEVQHMERQHPEIIAERLRGFGPGEPGVG